ncbi:MAG: hypothetical protein ACIALR_05090 [Blastopirellula sp. JB062]
MLRKWMRLTVLGLFLLAMPGSMAHAEWGFYNPFASTSAKKTAKKEPSTLSKMNESTQEFFSKTADFLNPFDDDKAKPKRKVIPSLKKPKKESDKSWWSSLFGPSEPEPPETVDQFMSLERPRF